MYIILTKSQSKILENLKKKIVKQHDEKIYDVLQ